MKKLWILVADRFDALLPRERLVVFLCLISILCAIFYFGSVQPALARYEQGRQAYARDEKRIAKLREQEVALIRAGSIDPDAETRRQIEALQRERMGKRKTMATNGLVDPARAAAILRHLIAEQGGVELVSMRAGEVVDLLAAEGAAGKVPVPGHVGLYRHSLKLSLRGSYTALSRYVAGVEKLSWQPKVAELKVATEQWPQARLDLTLHVNSLERAWLAF